MIYHAECNYFIYKNTGGKPKDIFKDRFHGVPKQNKDFVDRPNILENMKAALTERFLWSTCRIVVLTGREEVGKTQLMLHYSYLHRDTYKFAVWLKVDDRSVTADSFRKLANTLGFDGATEEGSNSEAAIKWIRTSFEKETNWLLLLDNADDVMAKEIFSLLPRSGGHIILTTRKPDILKNEAAAVIPIDKMEEREARSLLLGESLVDSKSIIYPYIQEIITKLDFMPLPIKLARAYKETRGITFQQYVSIFKKKRISFFPCCNEDSCAYYDKHAVVTAWYLSFEQVRAAKPATVRILEICALLQAGPSLLPASSASELESEQFEENVQPVEAVLKIFSFVTQPSKEIENNEEGSEINLLKTYFPILKIINNLMKVEQRQHWAQQLKKVFNNEITQESADSLVSYLEKNGNLSTETLTKLVISVPEVVYGSEHPSTAVVLSDLAKLYSSQGNYVEAEVLYRRSLEIYEALHEPNRLMILRAYSNLADVCVVRRKFDEAEHLYRKVINTLEQTFGSDHSPIAGTLCNLAELYGDQQKYDDSERLYLRALIIRENAFGPEHQSVARVLNNLAVLYEIREDYTEAEVLYKRTLEIREKVLGTEHTDVATSLNNLAHLYHSQKKHDLAESHYQRALAICKTRLGPEDPSTAECQSNLGDFYLSLCKYEEAEKYHQAALKIWNRIFGNDSLYSVISRGRLKELYSVQGIEYKVTQLGREMEPSIKKLLEVEDPATVLGPDHPDTASFLSKWADICNSKARYDHAEQLYKRALVIREKTLGSGHSDTIHSLNDLVIFYTKWGKHEEARLCRRAPAIRARADLKIRRSLQFANAQEWFLKAADAIYTTLTRRR